MRSASQSRDYMNIDNITWECDYPHSDSTWPTAPEALMKYLDGVSDEDINKMTHLNAMKHFQFDPFSVRAREKCTVEALRAEAADVDTSLVSRARGQTEKGEDGIVSVTSFTTRSQPTTDHRAGTPAPDLTEPHARGARPVRRAATACRRKLSPHVDRLRHRGRPRRHHHHQPPRGAQLHGHGALLPAALGLGPLRRRRRRLRGHRHRRGEGLLRRSRPQDVHPPDHRAAEAR